MSTRGLAALSALLLVLCLAAAGFLVDRLGWRKELSAPEWEFVNETLSVARGQRVVLRPMLQGEATLRYTFLVEKAEPATDDPMAPVPHVRAGVDEQEEGGGWVYRPPPEAFAFCQMGALTPQEWLVEIRPVAERGGASGARTLLKASFGHRNGAAVAYYHDPERRVPVFGWVRRELVPMGGGIPEVLFASDGGVIEAPPLPPKKEKPK